MYLSELNIQMIQLLLLKSEIPLKDLSYQFHIPIKKLKYEIKKIASDFDIHLKNDALLINDTYGVKEKLHQLSLKNMIFNENERIDLILFYLLTNQPYISIEHLMALTQSSRNTVLQDLKTLKKQVNVLNGKIEYNRTTGYLLKINNEDRDLIFINLVYKISNKYYALFLLQYLSNTTENYLYAFQDEISTLINTFDKNISETNVNALKFAYYTLEKYIYISKNKNIHYVNGAPQLNVLKAYPPIILMMVHSMSHTNNGAIVSDEYSEKILLDFIHQFEIFSGVIIINKDDLLTKLSRHFYPAVLRARYGIDTVVNTQFIEDESLSPIITFTKRAIKYLEQTLEIKFSHNEIVLWSLYFAGALRNQGNVIEKKIVGIVLCPNGVAISHAITQKLQQHFSAITFLEPSAISKINQIEDQIDIVFSTHPIKSNKQVFLISTMPSRKELDYLGDKINEEFSIHFKPHYSLNDLLEVIREHTDIRNERALIKDIQRLLTVNSKFKEAYQPMLKELLTKEFIQTNIDASDWKDAIQQASEPLLSHHIITQDYVTSMINSVIELGPYIVIMPEVAIPHSRSEDGAIEVGLSLANFKTPILFPNDKPVKLMIVLSAKDEKSHLKALAEMTELLGNETYVDKLKQSDSVEVILNLINKVYQ